MHDYYHCLTIAIHEYDLEGEAQLNGGYIVTLIMTMAMLVLVTLFEQRKEMELVFEVTLLQYLLLISRCCFSC